LFLIIVADYGWMYGAASRHYCAWRLAWRELHRSPLTSHVTIDGFMGMKNI
jgi:hypothetical protein